MEVLRNGKFSLPITSENLSKGLRRSDKNILNKHGLVECFGAIGDEGVLTVLEDLTRFETPEITDGFPYPQIFISPNIIIVCGATSLYEKSGYGLVLKLSGLSEGSTWSAVIWHDYAYLSNGRVAVVRDSDTKDYAITTDLPTAMAMCSFNGQAIIGAPDAGYNS